MKLQILLYLIWGDIFLNIIRKNSGLERLEKNLKFLYILNIVDLFFTKILLRIGPDMFMEANEFLKPIINGYMSYVLKIFVFGIILIYWYKRSFSSNEKQLKISIYASKVCLVLYLLINILHIIYTIMFFYIKF